MSGWQDLVLDGALDAALSPALWLAAFLAVAFSLLFYLWRGGGRRQLGRDLLAGLTGFAIGQALGMALHLPDLRLGQVQLIWGALGCAAGLVARRYFPTLRQMASRRMTSRAHSIPRLTPSRKNTTRR